MPRRQGADEKQRPKRELECLGAKHRRREADLRRRIRFGDQQRPDVHRLVHQPGNHERADDHDIARDDEDREPRRNRAENRQRDVDRNEQRLVGQRIEISPEFRLQVEGFGQPPVDGVGNAGER